MAAAKALYREHGALGVLAHLLESKLIFPEEYELLRGAVTNPSKSIAGAEEIVSALVAGDGEWYRAEDLFELIGLLARVSNQSGRGLKQLKLNGSLAKLPFGSTGRTMARWKTRFFRLEGSGLIYYAREEDSKPKGQLVLAPSTHIRDSAATGREHCFNLLLRQGGNRTLSLSLSAQSGNEKEAWICALARAVHASRAGESALQSAMAPSVSLAHGNIVNYMEETAPMLSGLESCADNNRSGMLLKLSSKSRKNWRPRHFTLYRNLLSFFESDEDKRALGDIILDDSFQVVVGLPSSVDPQFLPPGYRAEGCFHLVTQTAGAASTGYYSAFASSSSGSESEVAIVLAAESPQARGEWMDSLRVAVEHGAGLLISLENGPNSPGGSAGARDSRLNSAHSSQSERRPVSGSWPGSQSLEVIVSRKAIKGSAAESIGVLPVTEHDTLISLRSRIYQELEDADVPVAFTFLVRLARQSSQPVTPSPQSSPVDRTLCAEYTKISRKQEEYIGIDKFVSDDGRVFIVSDDSAPASPSSPLALAAACAHKLAEPRSGAELKVIAPAAVAAGVAAASPSSTAPARSSSSSAPSLPPSSPSPSPSSPSSSATSGPAAGFTSEDGAQEKLALLEAQHAAERRSWEREMRKLQAELADARRALAERARGRGSGAQRGESPAALSPLESKLTSLQRDGYIEPDASVSKLSHEFECLFSADDLSGVVLDDNGPFAALVRRHGGEPAHVRAFVDALQAVLRTHTLSKARLTQPWWRKKLSEASFLRLPGAELVAWAKAEPWTEDTPERYAYLMGKMRPGAVTDEDMRLVAPVPKDPPRRPAPRSPPGDGERGEGPLGRCLGRRAGEAEQHAESKGGEPSPRAPPPFLAGIKAAGGAPAFLAGIQGFDRSKLQPRKAA